MKLLPVFIHLWIHLIARNYCERSHTYHLASKFIHFFLAKKVKSAVTLLKKWYMESASDHLAHFLFRERQLISNFAQILVSLSYYKSHPSLKQICKKTSNSDCPLLSNQRTQKVKLIVFECANPLSDVFNGTTYSTCLRPYCLMNLFITPRTR